MHFVPGKEKSNRVLFSCKFAHPNSSVLLQISLGGVVSLLRTRRTVCFSDAIH